MPQSCIPMPIQPLRLSRVGRLQSERSQVRILPGASRGSVAASLCTLDPIDDRKIAYNREQPPGSIPPRRLAITILDRLGQIRMGGVMALAHRTQRAGSGHAAPDQRQDEETD